MELSVIVPCLDEEANVAPLVERVAAMVRAPAFAGGAELLLVDDGSTDGTWAALERAQEAHPFVIALRHARNRGIPEAWRTGVQRARGRLVCLLDADLQYRPEDVPRLYAALEDGALDVVQGARAPAEVDPVRYAVSRGLSHLLNASFSMHLPDNKSGFLLCRREVLADLLAYRRHYAYWQVLVMVAAHAKGYRLGSVPVAFEPRRAGRSFLGRFPVGVMARVCLDVGRGLLEYRLGLP